MSVSGARWVTIVAFAAIVTAPLAFANESSDRAAIEAAAQAWVKALNARDTNALIALATEDLVVIDANNPPMTGARAREAWTKAHRQLTSISKEIVISGDVAWRIAVLGKGQALEIWKRVGGQWKIHRQMSFNVLTPSNLLSPPSEPALDRPTN
jgi:ketosteroid isomerase-like protein